VTIYFDTSALAKLMLAEAETNALREWIGARSDQPLVTNTIGVVELQRLAARVDQTVVTAAIQLLGRIGQLELTPSALVRAAQFPPPEVRTLDALHLASAAELNDLRAVVTYDQRMFAAAIGHGLPVESPA
jgi:predicted nucleic acid-binding protein